MNLSRNTREPSRGRQAIEWARGRVTELGILVGPAVLPLVLENERDDPEVIASCVLLRIATDVFLLTAAHVLDWKERGPLYLVTEDKALPLVQEEQAFSSVSPGTREDDPLDIALLKLTGEALLGVENRTMFDVQQIDPDDTCLPGTLYFALGYPLSKIKLDRPGRRATVPAMSIVGEAKPKAVLRSPRRVPINLPMGLHRKHMVVGQNFQTGTHPRGMSGGALIRLESLHPKHTARDDRLVGVLTEYFEANNLLLATNIAIYLEAIRQQYPRLSDRIPRSTRVQVNIVHPTA